MKYKAVVESGSCSPDYQRWEERADCGHLHRSIEAAEKCLAKHQQWYCQHGRIHGLPCRHCLGRARGDSTSALWYNGNIHDQDGRRI